MYSFHFVLCIVLYALCNIHCILCIVFMHFVLRIVFYALYCHIDHLSHPAAADGEDGFLMAPTHPLVIRTSPRRLSYTCAGSYWETRLVSTPRRSCPPFYPPRPSTHIGLYRGDFVVILLKIHNANSEILTSAFMGLLKKLGRRCNGFPQNIDKDKIL